MDVRAGVAYGIVVDGFDGKFGTYELAITAAQVPCYLGKGITGSLIGKKHVLTMCHSCHFSRYHASLRHCMCFFPSA